MFRLSGLALQALRGLIIIKASNALFAEEIVSFLTERGVLRAVARKVEFDAGAKASVFRGARRACSRRAWIGSRRKTARCCRRLQ